MHLHTQNTKWRDNIAERVLGVVVEQCILYENNDLHDGEVHYMRSFLWHFFKSPLFDLDRVWDCRLKESGISTMHTK